MIKITAVDPQDLPAILRIERLGFNCGLSLDKMNLRIKAVNSFLRSDLND